MCQKVMTESIIWAFLSEAMNGFWVIFHPKIPDRLNLNRKICIISLLLWISCWCVARIANLNTSIENLFGILGWVFLVVFVLSTLLIGTRFEKLKK